MTPHQRRAIRLPGFGGASPYKGVCRSSSARKPWRAQLERDGRHLYLGIFKTQIEAAKAYDKKAKELFGPHCFLNFQPSYVK